MVKKRLISFGISFVLLLTIIMMPFNGFTVHAAKPQYTIEFVIDGKVVKTITVDEGDTINPGKYNNYEDSFFGLDTDTINDLNSKYAGIGQWTDQDNDVWYYASSASGIFYTVTQNTVFTAQLNVDLIFYDDNDERIFSVGSYLPGSEAYLREAPYESLPYGKVFDHWEFNGISYSEGDKITVPSENAHIKAVYKNASDISVDSSKVINEITVSGVTKPVTGASIPDSSALKSSISLPSELNGKVEIVDARWSSSETFQSNSFYWLTVEVKAYDGYTFANLLSIKNNEGMINGEGYHANCRFDSVVYPGKEYIESTDGYREYSDHEFLMLPFSTKENVKPDLTVRFNENNDTISWDPISGADRYKIGIYNSATNTYPLGEVTSSETLSYNLKEGLKSQGKESGTYTLVVQSFNCETEVSSKFFINNYNYDDGKSWLSGLKLNGYSVIKDETSGKYSINFSDPLYTWLDDKTPGACTISNISSLLFTDSSLSTELTGDLVAGTDYYVKYVLFTGHTDVLGFSKLKLTKDNCSILNLKGYNTSCESVDSYSHEGKDYISVIFKINKIPTSLVEFDLGDLYQGLTFDTFVVTGEKVSKPSTVPVMSGYTFAGWYEDSSFNAEFDFENTYINEDRKIYGKWEIESTPGTSGEAPSKTPGTVGEDPSITPETTGEDPLVAPSSSGEERIIVPGESPLIKEDSQLDTESKFYGDEDTALPEISGELTNSNSVSNTNETPSNETVIMNNNLTNLISDASKNEGNSVIYFDDYEGDDSISFDTLKLLKENSNVILVLDYTFYDEDTKKYIYVHAVINQAILSMILDDDIKLYGPACLSGFVQYYYLLPEEIRNQNY